MPNELMIKLQHFFEADVRVKREMYVMAPPNACEAVDEESIKKYADNAYESLLYIYSELKRIAIDIFGSDSIVISRIMYLEEASKKAFVACGLDISKLRWFHENYVSNLRLEFLNLVKNECFGYIDIDTGLIAQQTTSADEMLHFIHYYVLNNDTLLHALPVIDQKKNAFDQPIVLRGTPAPMFEELYKSFPLDMFVGYTDMVIIDEHKLIMMVRDLGHALTIEITLKGQTARLEYFIPKVCNVDMVNKLPGVNKVKGDMERTTGATEVDVSTLPQSLFKFISMVPSDSDMVLKPPTF